MSFSVFLSRLLVFFFLLSFTRLIYFFSSSSTRDLAIFPGVDLRFGGEI